MRSPFVDGAKWVSTILFALATGILAQNSSTQTSPSQTPTLVRLCTSSDIADMNVLNCALWMINSGHDLMTTTYLVPGILQLHQIPDYWVGFNFAQDTVRKIPKNVGTLALNSVASRTAEQIHIHLCSNGNQKVRNVLDSLIPANHVTLASVDLSQAMPGSAMQCRIASQKDTNINQGGDILKYLQSLDQAQGSNNCAQYHVGSGYMVDKIGFARSCVTTAGSAEEIFC
ncbi:hypothetical protein N7520_003602 [Penicillium odoratum]|uniref:uncharacterized protein n=1 Tax=Penicillium odoratum TaxID=1167516 RepID=UPI002547B40F|nr:uncharacterized protein N7520_003602 [Penicillium odoratum]KAJ5769043.1 hypothetical protein N7520_003602 [Penicillium odoratum]